MSHVQHYAQPAEKIEVREVMSLAFPIAPSSLGVGEAKSLLEREGGKYLLVVDSVSDGDDRDDGAHDDEVIGIVGVSDLERADNAAALSSCMRTPVLGICERATIDEAARLMSETGLGCLPVFWPDGRLLGVVTRNEIHVPD